MATYLILNLVFLGVVVIMLALLRPSIRIKRVLITMAIVLIFTALFDPIIVGLGIVDYDYTKTLGIAIGSAPVEDFFYAVMAAIIVPIAWELLGRHREKN